ncbi:metalloregulator ArsR/SmtB family transcription factor [Lentzea sp. BCCO 10_0798]|uniref:Metalloregulator ArsR/SmtB family transcription factor n=1 Tax=Lentzea kristufekii TaxID=3095430 RepID=A0ABU4TJM8_9PSEU|nr:metalloregulator ArsR/SmtB family transcription factor [Lentzea sp. BCCO 10_0798]MDX8048483.1 metalloregulator ArsR/SmtB family transcription factor [Lentzea sp. BCCO 10_0798]
MYARDDVATTNDWQQLPTGGHVDAAVDAFRMLADPTRFRMLWLLCGDEYDVTTLAEKVGIARPAVSQHLTKLRLTALVTVRRDGRRAVYSARGGHVRRLLLEAVNTADHHLTGEPDHD